MKNFKDWTKGQKVGCGIAIVIVILLVIWGCVALNKNDTTETISAEVETSESVSSELVADVETLESTEAVVETEATTEVPGTEAVESEVIESTEASVETEELQTEEVEVLSEAVPSNTPGDTVISTAANSVKPVSGRPYLKYDEAGYIDYYGSWTTGKTWTASNGVVLKINDFGQEVDVSNPSNRMMSIVWWEDPDANYEPNSTWMNAANEFMLSNPGFKNGTDRFDATVVDVSKLPAVLAVSSKQPSITMTDEFRAYKEMWDAYHNFQASGNMTTSVMYDMQVNSDFIGSSAAGQGYMWEIRKDGDGWKLTINKNLGELDWHGLKTALKLITPDAEALYNEFYKQCYEDNPTFPEYDMWVTIGGSQAMVSLGDGCGYFYFK